MPAQEKTEAATHKKRKDERKKGNVFQSKDVITAVSTLVLFVLLKFLMPFIYEYLSDSLREFIGYAATMDTLTTSFAVQLLKTIAISIFVIAGPVMIASMVIGVVSSGVQTRFIFSRETLKFKFSHINPLQGFKKMFSARTVVELIKSIIKAVIIGFIVYNDFGKILKGSMTLIRMDLLTAIGSILNSVMNMVMKLSIVFVAIAVADYAYQWWDHEKNIKMTKQEVKEEYKQTEGDPQIKGKIKDMQRRRATQRMMQQVPTADVVVRNPTHFAVALKYDLDKNAAPIVVAKGQDHLALRIIAEAEKYNVPLMENRPLARALYAQVELGHEIPPEHYSALAEILAWVYSLKKDVK